MSTLATESCQACRADAPPASDDEITTLHAELAEQAGHHPALLTEWGRVIVSWWSHKLKGLHRNDFIMAARTDRALGEA